MALFAFSLLCLPALPAVRVSHTDTSLHNDQKLPHWMAQESYVTSFPGLLDHDHEVRRGWGSVPVVMEYLKSISFWNDLYVGPALAPWSMLMTLNRALKSFGPLVAATWCSCTFFSFLTLPLWCKYSYS